jgi:hypothetical protein
MKLNEKTQINVWFNNNFRYYLSFVKNKLAQNSDVIKMKTMTPTDWTP